MHKYSYVYMFFSLMVQGKPYIINFTEIIVLKDRTDSPPPLGEARSMILHKAKAHTITFTKLCLLVLSRMDCTAPGCCEDY